MYNGGHKYGVLLQDHFTDMLNGDMDGSNNTAQPINRGMEKFSNHCKILITVFRTIYNFKAHWNKNALHKVKICVNAIAKLLQDTILLCKIFVDLIIYIPTNIFHHCS